MVNRLAIAIVAVVVGIGLYAGLVFVDGQLRGSGQVAPDGEVIAGNATMHLDRVGRPTVVGEVRNGYHGAIGAVRVSVEFYEDGAVVGTASGTTLVPTIPRQTAAPFVVRLDDRSALPDGYDVTVAYEAATDGPYTNFDVNWTLSDDSQDQVVVTGTVTNDGGRAVTTHVVATFYDADGRVVGARSVRPSPGVLEPGAGGEFAVRFRTLGDLPSRAAEVESYELVAYGEPVASG